MTSLAETLYRDLTKAAAGGLEAGSLTDSLVTCISAALQELVQLSQNDLTSKVPGKDYFVFVKGAKSSRGINTALFEPDVELVVSTLAELIRSKTPGDPLLLQRVLYTAAISYPALIDVLKEGDRKSPGTFLEVLVGHLVASIYNVRPTTTVTAPTLDIQVSLPTDLIFDLGEGKGRLHLPVKASTRERVIQVWAHQRVLDGMHGVNRFRGVMVVLAETNRQTKDNSIAEVCLPGQWTAYQMYIAQLFRVYYFDVPEKYRQLRTTYPFLEVRPFADFFYEYEAIATPTAASHESIDPTWPPSSLIGFPENEEV